MSDSRRPSFFITGHSKCGTTALANFLDQHPELFMCSPKEPAYFSPTLCRADGPPSQFVKRTEEEYLALFEGADPGQICGEASAVYLYSPEAPALIRDFDPGARLIMIFREPADFLRSYHLQMLKNVPTEGETVKDLRRAIELEPARRAGREIPRGCVVPELLYYTDRLRYADQYDRWAQLFPQEQILPLIFDDFRRDNAGTVRRVFEFLGVDSGFEPDLAEHNTGGAAVRSTTAHSLARRATHGGGALALGRRALPKRARKRMIDAAFRSLVFKPAPPRDRELAAEIQALARDQVEALGARMSRDLLAEWNYDRAAAAAAT